MNGLKLAAILGVVFFASNSSAFKLKIVKKSATVGHNIVDQSDLDSNNTETSLRDQFDRFNDDISIEGIKVKRSKVFKRQTATYKQKTKRVKKEVEPLIEENDISKDLPSEATSEEQTLKTIKKSIQDEFEDEISMAEEIEDQNSLSSASIGY